MASNLIALKKRLDMIRGLEMQKESRAIPKMCGIETELGLIAPNVPGGGAPAANKFFHGIKPEWLGLRRLNIKFDPRERLNEGKNPDAEFHSFMHTESWRLGGNILLKNGARFYVDGPHPEISSPLCRNPLELLIWNRACYRWLEEVIKQYRESGEEYRLIRNNIGTERAYRSSRGNALKGIERASFGSHINICEKRDVEWGELIEKSVPFFVSLPITCGAGKVGSDYDRRVVHFQISQRADFFLQEVGEETIHDRAIFNTRDAPYADARRFRRIHIIPFDSNMLELPEYLKAGLLSILFMMIEDGELDERFTIYDAVSKMHEISVDLSVKTTVRMVNQKKTRKITDCLLEYSDLFWEYLEAYHPQNEILKDVVRRWRKILGFLSRGKWPELYGKLDWVTKMMMIEEALAKKGKGWNDYLAQKLDIEYHDNGTGGIFYGSLAKHPNIVRLTTEEQISSAMHAPPPTRSAWICEIVQKRFPDLVASSDCWYRVSLKDPASPRPEKPNFLSVTLPDPTIPWEKETAEKLSRLELPEFLEELTKLGLGHAAVDRLDLSTPAPPSKKEGPHTGQLGNKEITNSLRGLGISVKDIKRILREDSGTKSGGDRPADANKPNPPLYVTEKNYFDEEADTTGGENIGPGRIFPRESDDLYERSLGLIEYGSDTQGTEDDKDEGTEENPAEGSPS